MLECKRGNHEVYATTDLSTIDTHNRAPNSSKINQAKLQAIFEDKHGCVTCCSSLLLFSSSWVWSTKYNFGHNSSEFINNNWNDRAVIYVCCTNYTKCLYSSRSQQAHSNISDQLCESLSFIFSAFFKF